MLLVKKKSNFMHRFKSAILAIFQFFHRLTVDIVLGLALVININLYYPFLILFHEIQLLVGAQLAT